MKPIDQTKQRQLVDNYGLPMQKVWEPICFDWDISDGEKARDIFLYLGYILIVNRKGKDVLGNVIHNIDCEVLPIFIKKEEYFVLNVLTIYSDVLDIKKSKIEYFKDKNIKWIHEYVFKSKVDESSIFHIAEIQSPLFVNDNFVDAVNESGLVGLSFKECKQASNSILSLIFK